MHIDVKGHIRDWGFDRTRSRMTISFEGEALDLEWSTEKSEPCQKPAPELPTERPTYSPGDYVRVRNLLAGDEEHGLKVGDVYEVLATSLDGTAVKVKSPQRPGLLWLSPYQIERADPPTLEPAPDPEDPVYKVGDRVRIRNTKHAREQVTRYGFKVGKEYVVKKIEEDGRLVWIKEENGDTLSIPSIYLVFLPALYFIPCDEASAPTEAPEPAEPKRLPVKYRGGPLDGITDDPQDGKTIYVVHDQQLDWRAAFYVRTNDLTLMVVGKSDLAEVWAYAGSTTIDKSAVDLFSPRIIGG